MSQGDIAAPDLALIAGTGALPALLMRARPDMLLCELEGFASGIPGTEPLRFRVERLVPFMTELTRRGIRKVCFAGAIRRPKIEPAKFDLRTALLVPRIMGAIQQGDDATLRAVIALFEERRLEVIGADHIAPDLLGGEGVLCGKPTETDRKDMARAAEIVAALGAVDVGQGAVVARGLCLAVEALPGTDAMLDFVATTRPEAHRGGVLMKAPKPGQDLRIDMPAIGPRTVEGAARARLSCLCWRAGGVLLLDRAAVIAAAEKHGIALWGVQA
ncbi:LpxI family protein [Paenirhodobacter enshiensis]|uniref:Phosphatidate cytidylyltransferase n=1 Tax=Paenirhodobacter enshiensis TaxID=1105367 RepID=A0A086XWN5_9RHOB|nr:UDP-2,3-diacylglucosamine diphosphatase LpxI [Paenirhodobacter enshiensis]KFI26435.1 phosphatidate cytidylyltransferase [Paenirhodobacter enshiensis]